MLVLARKVAKSGLFQAARNARAVVSRFASNIWLLPSRRGLLQSLQKFSEVYLPRQQIENRARIFDPVPVA
mgnify:CR=1 FL=1